MPPPKIPKNPATRYSFGARLRHLRQARGLSQRELASRLGVTPASVCGWESNRARPQVDRLLALEELFGLPVDQLLEGNPEDELQEELKRSRKVIARLMGTTPDKIRITVDL